MIVETAIISVAAIIVASLMTANAIHKRAVATEIDYTEARRVLERQRAAALERRDTWQDKTHVVEVKNRNAWQAEVDRIDAELLKLAKGDIT